MAEAARDIIADGLVRCGSGNGMVRRDAESLIKRLEAAGYRILAPGQFDPATIEAAAKVGDRRVASLEDKAARHGDPGHDFIARLTDARQEAKNIAFGIRALQGER